MEEHDAALEELQSSNEEAVSSNEELQSVNEELQTAKEEVQSANEELATLNRELQERNVQLGQANDALKRSGDEIQRALDYANAIVSTVRGPLLIMDGELRVEKANRAYYDTFAVRPEETEGRLLYELGDGQWDFPGLRTALGEVLPKDSSFEGFEVEQEFPEIGRRTMVLNARRLRNEHGGSERILLAIEDRTELKRAEQARDALLVLEHAARERAEAADQLKDEFVATVSHELRGPLTAMVGWMHILTTAAARRDPATLASGLAAINRGIKAQSRLIADLLDHSRIVTGKLQISRRLVDLATIAEAAVEGAARGGAGQGHRPRAVARSPRRRRPGRPRPPAAGALEPLQQRRQVHAAGRARPGLGRARGDLRAPQGHRHRPGHRARTSCPTSSSASARPRARLAAASPAWGWASPSCGSSSSCTAGRSRRRAPARAGAPPSRSSCPSPPC